MNEINNPVIRCTPYGLRLLQAIWIGQVVAVVALCVFPHQSFACSPQPIAMKPGPNGRPVPVQRQVYMFVGEVLSDSTVTAMSSTGEKQVTALSVLVVESENLNTAPGNVHQIYQLFRAGNRCEHWGPKPLTTSDFPIGAKIQVFANTTVQGAVISIPAWDLRRRIFRVD